jgi:hypothetical protein
MTIETAPSSTRNCCRWTLTHPLGKNRLAQATPAGLRVRRVAARPGLQWTVEVTDSGGDVEVGQLRSGTSDYHVKNGLMWRWTSPLSASSNLLIRETGTSRQPAYDSHA